MCERVCPVLNKTKEFLDKPVTYGAKNKNEEIRKNSSSGGVFYPLAENVIANNGVVFGAKFNDEFEVIHSYAQTIEEVKAFCTSKYVQSRIGESFKECKKFLEQNRLVLFTGTPCQINGLKSFLQKDYENLICMDFICHGTPSPKFWKLYKNYREKKSASRIVKTSFRHKNYGWMRYSMSFSFANDIEYLCTLDKDPYLQIFLKDYCLRNSCYDCASKGFRRASDITVADFWGIKELYPEHFDDKGVSLVFVNTQKGKNIIQSVEQKLELFPADFEKATKYNPSYSKSVLMPKQREKFFVDLDKLPFKKILKKYGDLGLRYKIKILKKLPKWIIKKILGKKGTETLKRILGR